MKKLFFLVGSHGSGKSTIGRILESQHGFKHLSVGDLIRLARKGLHPDDISLKLMICLASLKTNHPMPDDTVHALIRQIQSMNESFDVVVDGFPSDVCHLSFLPKNARLIQIFCNEETLSQRLEHRSQVTNRRWTPNLFSQREANLPMVVEAASKLDGMLAVFSNQEDGRVQALSSEIASL